MNRPHAAPEPDAPRQWLSDLADGRLGTDALAEACGRWEADAEARRTWHAYQLIGDVLRSDDLARPAGGDAAFLAALRQRLADEPVVMAPAPLAAPATPPTVQPAQPVRRAARAHRPLWLVPMAAAAGFVAVAGVMVVLQSAPGGNGFDAPQMAATPPAAVTVRAMAPAGGVLSPAAGLQGPAGAGQMLRDARVDEYLRAHREVLVASPAALPGGAVRTVDFESAPAR